MLVKHLVNVHYFLGHMSHSGDQKKLIYSNNDQGNFMTPEAGVLVLGHGHTSENALFSLNDAFFATPRQKSDIH